MICVTESKLSNPEQERRRLAKNIKMSYNDYMQAVKAADKFQNEQTKHKIDTCR